MPKKIKSKERQEFLGTVELLVLASVKHADEAYGMEVYDAVRQVYPRISFASVYTSLENMILKEYLTGEFSEPVRGGRPRKCYRATALGKKMLASTLGAIQAIQKPSGGFDVALVARGKAGQ